MIWFRVDLHTRMGNTGENTMTSNQMKTILQLSVNHKLSKGDLLRAMNALMVASQLSDADNSPKAKRLRRSADDVKSTLGANVYNVLRGCLRSF